MRSDLEHLPHWKRVEIERIRQIILEEFEDALADTKQEWKVNARIIKIILFGSHARGDWVHQVHTKVGRHSDYDILIVVNDDRLTNYMEYWTKLGQKLRLENSITHKILSPVQFIVHSIGEVNGMLKHGRYFFLDVIREGVAIYESGNCEFADAVEKTPEEALDAARQYFDNWYSSAGDFWSIFNFALSNDRLRNSAFQLHQCVERLYNAVLLTCTFYTPYSHSLTKLRGFAEETRPELFSAWPRATALEVDAFEKLQEAYVKARYMKDFHVDRSDLEWLGNRTNVLMSLVEKVCGERIAELEGIVQSR